MDLQEKIYNLMKEYPLAALATIAEDGRPWVRFIMIDAEKDLSVRFATPLNSRKVVQINRNPEVHLACGAALVDSLAPYLQISGTAKISRDETIRNATWRDALKRYFTGPDDANYCVGIIEPYRIEYYCMPKPPEVWKPAKR
jgi:general stress protein 26